MSDMLSTILISLGTGIAGGFSGWIFTRKRQNLENIDMALDTWQKVVGNLEVQVDKLLKKVDCLTEENTRLKQEVSSLRDELLMLNKKDRKIEMLEKKVQRYEKILDDNSISY